MTLYYLIIHLLVHSTQQLFTGCLRVSTVKTNGKRPSYFVAKSEQSGAAETQINSHRAVSDKCCGGEHAECGGDPLALLCGITEAYPVEATLVVS